MKKKKPIIFLCGARDFHAMDWYKSAKELINDREVSIVTDLITGEGFIKLINNDDIVYKLLILDNLLFKKQSSLGNLWRNILKLIVLPLQVALLRNFSKKKPDAIYHAHSMYYLWLAWLAGIPFIGTPQGSDILIKPFKSKFFKFLSAKAMRAALALTVDSKNMQEKAESISGIKPFIIQNGIDLASIEKLNSITNIKNKRDIPILSIRGFTELYRIKELIKARNKNIEFTKNITPITFIYPFYEQAYKIEINLELTDKDNDLGRVDSDSMYKLMLKTQLVISIPISDSSPRSVYESIFCGAAVAVVKNNYLSLLPECMLKRIIIIDLNNNNWLEQAHAKAKEIIQQPYIPSEQALEMFDQRKSFLKIVKLFSK